jgi:hypothetical protein
MSSPELALTNAEKAWLEPANGLPEYTVLGAVPGVCTHWAKK